MGLVITTVSDTPRGKIWEALCPHITQELRVCEEGAPRCFTEMVKREWTGVMSSWGWALSRQTKIDILIGA